MSNKDKQIQFPKIVKVEEVQVSSRNSEVHVKLASRKPMYKFSFDQLGLKRKGNHTYKECVNAVLNYLKQQKGVKEAVYCRTKKN